MKRIDASSRSYGGFGPAMLLFLIVAAPAACFAGDPDPVALLQGVENARVQLSSCRIEMILEYSSPPAIKSSYHLEVAFEHDRRRFKNLGNESGRFCSIFDGTEALVFNGDSATIRDMAQSTADYLFDPRTIGITATYHWDGSVQSSVGYHKAKSVTLVGTEVIEGKSTRHVHVIDSFGQNLDYWIEPAAGFPVIRFDFQTKTQHSITISRYEGSVPALPSMVRTEGYINGKLANTRTINVKRVECDSLIDPGTWTLAGLDLPVGTPVSDLRIRQRIGYWDGHSLTKEPVDSPRPK